MAASLLAALLTLERSVACAALFRSTAAKLRQSTSPAVRVTILLPEPSSGARLDVGAILSLPVDARRDPEARNFHRGTVD
jgi:hypothetical protein